MNIKICSLILTLNSFSGGILIPVMTLLLLSKGLSLSQVTLLLGLYSLIVIVLEVPTGVASDLLGRKKVFVFSLCSLLVTLFIMFVFDNIIMLSLAFIFYGISRALSSGSLDALYIDWHSEIYGKEKLPRAMTNLSIIETIGLAFGAIIGGFLPSLSQRYFTIGGTYDLNLIVKLVLTSIVIILSILFVKEYDLVKESKKVSIKKHVQTTILIVKGNKILLLIFVSVFSTGFFLFLLETYWQPHLVSLIPSDGMLWILGIVSCLYFLSAIMGNLLSEKLTIKYKLSPIKLYKISRILLAFTIIIMAMQNNYLSFIAFYALTYLSFGVSNIPEGVIINSITPSENRSSILSFNSLIVQLGCLAASFISSFLIKYISISLIWIVGAIGVILAIAIFIFKSKEIDSIYKQL